MRPLHALPAALPPVALDAPLQRLRRVRAAPLPSLIPFQVTHMLPQPSCSYKSLTSISALPCRDSLFCHECSSHRVANDSAGPATLRVCDRCAFSAAHPEHLGCERPFACRRCKAPRNLEQVGVYLQLGLRLLACCAICSPSQWRAPSTAAQPLAAAEMSSDRPASGDRR